MFRNATCFVFFILLSSSLALNNHHRILSRHKNIRNPPHLGKRQDEGALFFDQKINHFDTADTRTFKQRYFVNEQNWKTNGPIFIYVGGEVSMSSGDVTSTQFTNYAASNGAVLIALEHRYFGNSQPFSDLSTDNIKYLSVEQALADAANFVQGFKTLRGVGNVPVVAFGSSYGGNLAVWLRQAYPEVFSSSLGSSAPVQLENDFYQYLVSVNTAINTITGSTACTQKIYEANAAVEQLLASPENWGTVATQFNGCLGNFNQALDTRTFMGSIMELWQTAVQYNDQNKIKNYCSIMTNGGDAMANLAIVNKQELDSDGSSCLNAFYSSFIGFYNTITLQEGTPGVVGYRQYFYLQCTQLGLFQTTSSLYPQQPFGTLVTPSLYQSECRDVFGIDHAPASAPLNTRFGGNNPKYTNVIFTNGALDPWAVLSVTSNIGNSIVSYIIPGSGHSADVYAYYGDSDMANAQAQVGTQLTKFVSAYQAPVATSTSAVVTPTSAAATSSSASAAVTSTSAVVTPTSDAATSSAGVASSSQAVTSQTSAAATSNTVPVQIPSNAPSTQEVLSTINRQQTNPNSSASSQSISIFILISLAGLLI